MGVVIDFNKAKTMLKEKAILFKPVQEEKPIQNRNKKRHKIEIIIKKKKCQ